MAKYCSVAIGGNGRLYTYEVGTHRVQLGDHVTIPVGSRIHHGEVMELHDQEPHFPTKPILGLYSGRGVD